MNLSSLMAISPLDGRYHECTQPLKKIFSEYALIYYRFKIEIQWLIFLSQQKDLPDVPSLSEEDENILLQWIENFDLNVAQEIKNTEKVTNHDVKAVEYCLKERMQASASLKKLCEFIHFACTSEDINNLSYALMMSQARKEVLIPLCDQLIEKLSILSHQYAAIPMLARTHGQPATPTTVGKEMANFVARFKQQKICLESVKILGKFNGAVGNYNAHEVSYSEVDWEKISKDFVHTLGLEHNPYTTQIEPHDWIAEYSHALLRFHTIAIDLCKDMWGYISLEYFQQKRVDHEVGSSTMPHKINPIDFENAEGNFGFANAMLNYFAQQLPLSRWQRDLTDSTLLRNLGVAIGHSVIAFRSLEKGINKLVVNESRIRSDLDQNWEVLAEAIQTVMRRYQVKNAYEKLKDLTRGQRLTQTQLQAFIHTLDLPKEAKDKLLSLTPQDYIGKAIDLARNI